MHPLIHYKNGTPIFLALAFVCFKLSFTAQAVSPPPDGGYANFNTAEGAFALLHLNVSSGFGNTGLGGRALQSDITGSYNTATGYGALFSNTASLNTAIGFDALFSNSTGTANTASGARALFHNTDGQYNTATGYDALFSNSGGLYNTAVGVNALYFNQANGNCAFGYFALSGNTTATQNSAFGFGALASNTLGTDNTAVGDGALASARQERHNTAIGSGALGTLTDTFNGQPNPGEDTAIGYHALHSVWGGGLPDGGNNTAVGSEALGNYVFGEGGNTAVGVRALANLGIAGNNIALGAIAGDNLTDGDNNIDIGNEGVGGDSNKIRIGVQGTQSATYVAGIYQQPVIGDNAPVLIDATGKLGTAVGSSRRFKSDIKSMDDLSKAVLALRPVTFQYKDDKTHTPQFGLIAEKVAEINPDLVIRDKEGQIYSVRYDAVNAMLLNEFLKEHKAFVEEQGKVQEQGATIARLEKQVAALTAGLQKVSAQLQASKPAPQVVNNNQ